LTEYASVEWTGGGIRVLDQRGLPHEVAYRDLTDVAEVVTAIREMVVRGAPLIGAVAAYGLALAAQASRATNPPGLRGELTRAAAALAAARPTAVNLTWAVGRVLDRVDAAGPRGVDAMKAAALAEAQQIAVEDVRAYRQIGLIALPLIPEVATVIHHCNTGGVATVGVGTALGIIRIAHEQGKRIHVLVDETRPRLQGARLTAWELKELGIPHTVIVDGASGHFMRTKAVDLCLVGCDRVAANGDTANKIGTYNLALVARAHGVPFYVAAPTSTIDLTIPNGDAIPIEERSAREVTHIGDEKITPDGAVVANPAFDITPAAYITGIVTEAGIARPPYATSLAALVERVKAEVLR
jgi:methylthioribose-1-phosphate isomerase